MKINWSVLFTENNADLIIIFLSIVIHHFLRDKFYFKRVFNVFTDKLLVEQINKYN